MTESLSADKNKLRGKLRTGTLLRGYVIDSVLGYGGFGIVYGAHHAEVGYPIALKEFLPADLSVREGDSVRPRGLDCYEYFKEGKRRFLEEAKQLVQFRPDPGVVSCLDFFRANGTAYLVMEHVEGLSLAELLHRREKAGSPLDETQMVSVMVPLIEALSRVHAAGVLHRDIKPSNILIRREDSRPVLIDFGAAKQNAAQHSKSLAPLTEGYAAIEQVGVGDLGAWTDLYGVGAVMWRIVAGTNPPWDPPTPVSVVRRMHALVRDDSDPLPSAITIGDGKFAHQVLQAIDKCLRVREAERFRNCKELLDELQEDQLPDRDESSGNRFRNGAKSRFTSRNLGQAGVSEPPSVNDVGIISSPDADPDEAELEGASSLQEAAESGDPQSQYNLAQHYRYGIFGVPRDRARALVWFDAAGINGHPDAKWNVDHLSKEMSAAEDAEALFRIGTMFEQGGPVPRNREMALDLYRKAAKSGNAGAQGALGRWHETGMGGLHKSNVEAFAWYCVSAHSGGASSANARDRVRTRLTDQELTAAYFSIGQLYLDGDEIPLDEREARYWYTLAAKDAAPEAEFAMGKIYCDGLSVAEDRREALKWFRLAAEHGSVEAQDMLSTMQLD